jgi:hypothetical protein
VDSLSRTQLLAQLRLAQAKIASLEGARPLSKAPHASIAARSVRRSRLSKALSARFLRPKP